MRLKKHKWFLFMLIVFNWTFGQGDGNLLLQYRKGGDMSGMFRKWNFDLHLHGVYMKATGDYSSPKFGYAFGGGLQHKISKTFAVSSGLDFFTLSYQYKLSDNNSLDRIYYFSIPMTIRAFPSSSLFFEMGPLYHHMITAKNSEVVNLSQKSKTYPEGTFKNAFGWLFAIQYNIWRRFGLSFQYRFFKRPSDPGQIQKNNFDGYLLGIHYKILNPHKKRP